MEPLSLFELVKRLVYPTLLWGFLRRIAALRIGIIAHLKYPIAEPFAGGLEMHTHLLASKLAERGNDVTVFAAEGSTAPGSIGVCAPTAVNSLGEAAYQICDAKEHRAYLRIMDHLRLEPFDVIQNNSLHYLPLAMADLIAAPMLTTFHTPPFEPLAEAAAAAAMAHHPFVSVSDTILAEWSGHLAVSETIPNGVDLSRFSFHKSPCSAPYAVWYGRIVPEKGLHFAMDAARLAEMPLRFAGPTSDPDYFGTFIAPRMGRGTIYEGHLKHAELAKLVGHATVFLCTPCWEEPFGLVVAEALASGVPVAAFARGAIPQIVDTASGALARPDDAGSLAAAAKIAAKLSRNACRRRAEMVCDAELMVDRYVDFYARLAGKLPHLDLPTLPLAPTASAA